MIAESSASDGGSFVPCSVVTGAFHSGAAAKRKRAKVETSAFVNRAPFTRIEAFIVILDAMTPTHDPASGERRLRCYEIINRAELHRELSRGASARMAVCLLSILEQLASTERVQRMNAPPFQAFELAVELVQTSGRDAGKRAELRDKVKAIYRVPHRLAEKIVSVLTIQESF